MKLGFLETGNLTIKGVEGKGLEVRGELQIKIIVFRECEYL